MGSGASFQHSKSTHINRSTAEIVALLMPVYFVEEEPNQADVERAQAKWDLIIEDKSPHFHQKKGSPGYTQVSCIMLFYDSF